MKSLSALLTLAVLAGTSAVAQMSPPMVSEITTKISDHVWTIMDVPNAVVVGSHSMLVVDIGLGSKNGATAARLAAMHSSIAFGNGRRSRATPSSIS